MEQGGESVFSGLLLSSSFAVSPGGSQRVSPGRQGVDRMGRPTRRSTTGPLAAANLFVGSLGLEGVQAQSQPPTTQELRAKIGLSPRGTLEGAEGADLGTVANSPARWEGGSLGVVAIGKGQMGSAPMGPLQFLVFLTEGPFGYSR